jgi:cytidyltransferase-like protein
MPTQSAQIFPAISGFGHEDRIEHARRMGWMCDRVVEAGGTVIADFICPTPETRAAFGDAFTIWVNRIRAGRFENTNRMFIAPERHDVRVTADGSPEYWAEKVLALLRPSFDPQKPTALFIGRYQPFHLGHQRLIEVGLQRVGQVCVAVRDTHGIDGKNPLSFFAVKQRIETALSAYVGRFVVVPLPNITNVFYGRDVGYDVERIILDEETEAISATNVRNISGLHGPLMRHRHPNCKWLRTKKNRFLMWPPTLILAMPQSSASELRR